MIYKILYRLKQEKNNQFNMWIKLVFYVVKQFVASYIASDSCGGTFKF